MHPHRISPRHQVGEADASVSMNRTPNRHASHLYLLSLVASLLFSPSLLAGQFEIPAWEFDRGNAATFTKEYADAGPMIAYGGRNPILSEYDIDFPASGSYELTIRYASGEARPVDLLFDGKRVATVCRSATGSWNTSGSAWEKSASLYIPAGKHTLRLQRKDSFPHIVALRFDSPEIPSGCVLKRPGARHLGDPPPVPPFEPYAPEINITALRLAVQDLIATFGTRYSQGPGWLAQLNTLEAELRDPAKSGAAKAALADLQREALVEANPWIDFDELLLVRRNNTGPDLGLPRNWESNCSLPKRGYADALCLLPIRTRHGALTTLYKPDKDLFIGDVDLEFDGNRLLFSSVGTHNRWQVFELSLAGLRDAPKGVVPRNHTPLTQSTVRQLTGDQSDVDSYDACYLPDGRIIYSSTAPFIGVPCVYGSAHVANLFVMNADGTGIRRLCFDQEHDWCPTVLNNGRILYSRWEYADTPHSNTRLLFHMNPDGTEQMEFMGSNSYWPNAFFYARPIPGSPSRVVAVIGGHHDNPRMGELILFDTAQGRYEAGGVVQRIPGHGKKVEPIIRDGLTLDSWPKFLHPFPVSDKQFLVSCKPTPDAPWGLYLADVFDNLVPLAQQSDSALFEPIPLRQSPRPPIIPDKVNLARKDATVVIQDIYAGDGLRGLPRGSVKSLRLFTYHFAYQEMGGLLGVVGADGPWDIKRVIGTVPVNPDGSAHFKVPANTPISIQPLDADGKALQLMRSWMTAMPGEVVQCVGCHERQNSAPPPRPAVALDGPPTEITPWHGPTRGFSYAREVQPVIDHHCIRCHDGHTGADGVQVSDLRGTEKLKGWKSITPGNGGEHAGKFSVGYNELQRHVRRPGIESDYHVLTPMEFHADTTDLVQLLKKDHHGVALDPESWDRLITWIDLNCPYHGTWGEEIDKPGEQRARRRDLLKLYAGLEDDPEAVLNLPPVRLPPVAAPSVASASSPSPIVTGWPFDAAEAKRRQADGRRETHRVIELADGVKLDLVLIPAGEFVMGSATGEADERPAHRVRVDRPYWMAVRELDNQTYSQFDPTHDSRVEDKNTYQFGIHGYPANQPAQPVVRVSWDEAVAFCQWISTRTGMAFSLPTEAQWEYACRAGTATPFSYGGLSSDFSKHANLADAKLSGFASDPYTIDVPLANPTKYDDWIPKDSRFNDGALMAVPPGRYLSNAWGLQDMHGNVAEWTASSASSYATVGTPGKDSQNSDERRVVRGGSWRDIPGRSTSSFRSSYSRWQRVYNVGIRLVCPDTGSRMAAADRLQ